MYEELLKIGRKYVGLVAVTFINAILKKTQVDKDALSDKDLDVIAQAAQAVIADYGLSPNTYGKVIAEEIMKLKHAP
jgi:hypothetical protein